ncbi:MAG: putative cell wall-associated hydrolase [Bacteroidetes bacterium]|nr:putative cell wall-associated hydrolase [Bacteroidota bacterium]
MVTQLLFGDHYSVLESTEGWLKIKITYDEYECWINVKQHHRIPEAIYQQIQKQKPVYSSELIQVISNKNTGTNFPLTLGSRLPFFSEGKMSFDNLEFIFEGQTVSASEKKTAKSILSTAYLFLNAPYLWGGKNPLGIDCSGFTQIVYKLNGHFLPRDASQQVELGSPLNFVEEAEAGDLAFFDNEEGKIVHVGILLDHERIIHASGSVRIDRFDHYGIFNTDSKKYSHTLRVIKRLL